MFSSLVSNIKIINFNSLLKFVSHCVQNLQYFGEHSFFAHISHMRYDMNSSSSIIFSTSSSFLLLLNLLAFKVFENKKLLNFLKINWSDSEKRST